MLLESAILTCIGNMLYVLSFFFCKNAAICHNELGIEDVIESHEMSMVKSHQNFNTTKVRNLEDIPHNFLKFDLGVYHCASSSR